MSKVLKVALDIFYKKFNIHSVMTNSKNRRNFIKNTAAASALAFVPFSGLQSMTLKKDRKFKMGITYQLRHRIESVLQF